MSPPRLLSAPLLFLLLAPACGDETVAPDGDIPSASARDRLIAGARYLALQPDQASISLDVHIRGADGWTAYTAEPTLRTGSLALSAQPDGTLELATANLRFEDIEVGDKGVPPTGLHLTGISVYTRVAHECEWVSWAADGDACSAGIPAVFYLDWSMVATDGVVHPLATQELEPMDAWVNLAGGPDGIAADMNIVAPGLLWSWAGIVEFRDLQLSVPGHELIPFGASD